MPYTPDPPFPKEKGNPLRSKDWNQLVNEVQRLDSAKVNKSGNATLQGPVGIGLGNNAIPKAPLHIAGGNWDLSSTEGDLRIGTDTHRLKIGMAWDGAGAGDVRIRAQGGTNRLILGSGTADRLAIQGNAVSITGSLSVSEQLNFGTSQTRQMMNLWNTSYGIGIQNNTAYFRTDHNFAWYRGGSHNNAVLNAGGGTAQMVLRNDRLGIGTTNPGHVLHITRPQNGWQTRFTNGTANIYMNNSSGHGIHINTGKTNATNRYALEVRNSQRTHFYVRDDGNVGVGTRSPGVRLDVNGDIRSGNALISDNPHGSSWAAFSHRNQGTSGGYALLQNSNGTTILNSASGRTLHLRINNTDRMTIGSNGDVRVNGRLFVTNIPFGDKRNMQWDSGSKLFYHDNSSRRHKNNIQTLKDNFSCILEAVPKTYTRPGNDRDWEIGYIAEEFHDLGLTNLVQYDENQNPDAINYRKICLYLIEILKEHKHLLEQHESKLSSI